MSDWKSLDEPLWIEPYYSTFYREDGSIVTNRGQVIAPPLWTRLTVEAIERKIDAKRVPSFVHKRAHRA